MTHPSLSQAWQPWNPQIMIGSMEETDTCVTTWKWALANLLWTSRKWEVNLHCAKPLKYLLLLSVILSNQENEMDFILCVILLISKHIICINAKIKCFKILLYIRAVSSSCYWKIFLHLKKRKFYHSTFWFWNKWNKYPINILTHLRKKYSIRFTVIFSPVV